MGRILLLDEPRHVGGSAAARERASAQRQTQPCLICGCCVGFAPPPDCGAGRVDASPARTGVGFVGLGVAADQMKRAQTPPTEGSSSVSIHLPGLLCVGTGGFFLSYATWRYFAVQAALRQGQFPINRGGVLAVVGASSVATVAGLTLLLAPEELELVVASVQGRASTSSKPQSKDG